MRTDDLMLPILAFTQNDTSNQKPKTSTATTSKKRLTLIKSKNTKDEFSFQHSPDAGESRSEQGLGKPNSASDVIADAQQALTEPQISSRTIGER